MTQTEGLTHKAHRDRSTDTHMEMQQHADVETHTDPQQSCMLPCVDTAGHQRPRDLLQGPLSLFSQPLRPQVCTLIQIWERG